jgi:hypothetical protein
MERRNIIEHFLNLTSCATFFNVRIFLNFRISLVKPLRYI